MFSGIIECVGQVQQVSIREQAMDLVVKSHFKDLSLGESVAVNGVCLTVKDFTAEGSAQFHISGETLKRTNLGKLTEGRSVNLERAVSLNTRLSGHIVQGHVDGTGVLQAINKAGDSYALDLFLSQSLRRYVVEKGSITLNGISLTVNNIKDEAQYEGSEGFVINLMIIPHTWEHTDLSTLSVGAELNVEVDVLAKYVETLCRFSPETLNLNFKGEK
ncbi:riboflavin synthase [Aristophania vespae]|uniref:Riboflavin synthase n=1 Tax=Aristophania vespae TaxID=2697033 RepID=A0A6P1NH37_9PROT|nr:riboflavin synthase [Aristophania vespae]QHI96197.1 riboflavin synthase [Aristophania vespae]UMM63989.1 Riboflavin synthase [Aristophania vespae]